MGRLWVLAAILATSTLASCGPRPTTSVTPSTAASDSDDADVVQTSAPKTENRDAPQGDTANGFLATPGELVGRVVNADGKPVANTTVHLVTKNSERRVTTDGQGQFKAQITEPTMVVVYGDARVTGSTAKIERIGGLEAIDVEEVEPPATEAKPLSNPWKRPPYSEKARDRNAWIRAWLLLEVSETGFVSRVKLLNPPGYDLDAIAVSEAFKLKFEPARNRTNKPVSSLVVWKFDWPPANWGSRYGALPANGGAWYETLPCRRKPSDAWYALNRPYRDCSTPNMAAAMTTPWIERRSK